MRWFHGMSVAEIKDALRTLSAAELADIEKLASDLRRAPASPREVLPTDPDVPAAMDAVFEKHRELLQRLAQ